MKNLSSILFVIFTVIFASCEKDPLNREFRTESPFIKIITTTGESDKDSEDNIGLQGNAATLVNSRVEFTSTSDPTAVSSRVWTIPLILPDSTRVNREFNQIENVVIDGDAEERYSIPNDPEEFPEEITGFPIQLIETLKDGTINRYNTNLIVRNPVKAIISEVSGNKVNEDIIFTINSLADLGLEKSDVLGDNQAIITWTFIEGIVQGSPGLSNTTMTSEGITSTIITTNTADPITVKYPKAGRYEVKLSVIRNFPVKSFANEDNDGVFVRFVDIQ